MKLLKTVKGKKLLKIEIDCLTQLQVDLEAHTINNNKLRRNADEANKDLVEAIEEELKEYDGNDNQEENNVLKILVQILREGKMPDIKQGTRTGNEGLVIFEQEVSDLPKRIYNKYANLENIVDKLHRANAEEEATKRALDDYINNLEDTHGPLTKKYKKLIKGTTYLKN